MVCATQRREDTKARGTTLLRHTWKCALIVSALPAWGVAAQGPIPADEILKQAAENQKKQVALRAQYCYRDHEERRRVGEDGKPGKMFLNVDYEIIYLEGGPYRKLMLRNGKPLEPKEAQEVEAQMQKTAAQRREEQKRGGPVRRLISMNPGGLDDMVRLMDNTLLREEEINGRKAWVIQSQPKKDSFSSSPQDAEVLCYRHLFWIDQEDHVVARHDAEVIRGGLDVRPGTTLKVTYAKEDGAVWFPRVVTTVAEIKPIDSPHEKYHEQVENRYSDFRKFGAQSTITYETKPK